MLISLLVLSPEQIYVPLWVKHDISYSGPITLLEPLVVLIGRHIFLTDFYILEAFMAIPLVQLIYQYYSLS